MKQMTRGLSRDPRAPYAASNKPERRALRQVLMQSLFDAKAYAFDPGTANLCDSLVADLKAAQAIMSRTPLPYQNVWIEYDRARLMADREALRKVQMSINPDSPFDPSIYQMGFLFVTDQDCLRVYTFRDRGPAVIEPFIELEFAKAKDGTIDFSNYIAADINYEASHSANDQVLQEEAEFIQTDLHIAFVFFALAGVASNGLEMKVKSARISLDAVRKKLPLTKKIQTSPQIMTVRLSELGRIHEAAVSEGLQGTGAKRASPRRHPVRGTLFERNGKLVWRPPHMRGSGGGVQTPTQVRDDLTPRGISPTLPPSLWRK
jgi:hypothetical protein